MSSAVPFLTRDYIESEADGLLAAYGEKFGPVTKPPIPADDILNIYLHVTLDFDNLPKLLGVGTDVFGATWIERGQVFIDESLDPTNHPERIGRYNFTVGHETGHWQLHRPYLLKNTDQRALFAQEQDPTVACRTSEAKDSTEWQADCFSSCLLMPKAMLKEYWRSIRNGLGRLRLPRYETLCATKLPERMLRTLTTSSLSALSHVWRRSLLSRQSLCEFGLKTLAL